MFPNTKGYIVNDKDLLLLTEETVVRQDAKKYCTDRGYELFMPKTTADLEKMFEIAKPNTRKIK